MFTRAKEFDKEAVVINAKEIISIRFYIRAIQQYFPQYMHGEGKEHKFQGTTSFSFASNSFLNL